MIQFIYVYDVFVFFYTPPIMFSFALTITVVSYDAT